MSYLDKLKKVQGNLENLDNKSKDEVIKFAQLIVKMSIKKGCIIFDVDEEIHSHLFFYKIIETYELSR